jgi:hypothetical protein
VAVECAIMTGMIITVCFDAIERWPSSPTDVSTRERMESRET